MIPEPPPELSGRLRPALALQLDIEPFEPLELLDPGEVRGDELAPRARVSRVGALRILPGEALEVDERLTIVAARIVGQDEEPAEGVQGARARGRRRRLSGQLLQDP